MRLKPVLSSAVVALLAATSLFAKGGKVFIAMNGSQANCLKAYGVAFSVLSEGNTVDWLLNYKGGAFVTDNTLFAREICKYRKVDYSVMSDADYANVLKTVIKPDFKKDVVTLTKPPRIAVYTPPNKGPWDDAVTLALTFAEIPFDKLYVDEVLAGKLDQYDWLHLHHEDFTGQQGKYLSVADTAQWYQDERKSLDGYARKNGFRKISQMQLAVVKRIKNFIAAGGNMFAMCSATDTYDIALAAEGIDICPTESDGDPIEPFAQQKLDFSKCLAFQNFHIINDARTYEFADIDNTHHRPEMFAFDSFIVHMQPAKFDPIAAMLCQTHQREIKGFMGQTTAFRIPTIKPDVTILAETQIVNEARYIHGTFGAGSFTFYGGHDPEDYRHTLHDPATNLELTPNSPGYRLILNNVLFPAAKKKNVPTVVYNAAKQPAQAQPAPADTTRASVESRIHMMPNPANGELLVTIDAGTIEVLAVINAEGKEVLRKTGSGNKVSIDMSNLEPGMYMLQVNSEYAGKIMKN